MSSRELIVHTHGTEKASSVFCSLCITCVKNSACSPYNSAENIPRKKVNLIVLHDPSLYLIKLIIAVVSYLIPSSVELARTSHSVR